MAHGDSMSHDPEGEPCLVLCTIKDVKGNPIEGVKVEYVSFPVFLHYLYSPDMVEAYFESDGSCQL